MDFRALRNEWRPLSALPVHSGWYFESCRNVLVSPLERSRVSSTCTRARSRESSSDSSERAFFDARAIGETLDASACIRTPPRRVSFRRRPPPLNQLSRALLHTSPKIACVTLGTCLLRSPSRCPMMVVVPLRRKFVRVPENAGRTSPNVGCRRETEIAAESLDCR
jgi:hypothetical protein